MVASYSSASPISWRPTARTLGALFAGSAVTLSATVMHGGSLLLTDDETGSIAEPSASPTVAEPEQLPAPSSTASLSGPGQAAPWTPGAAPQWGSSLKDLPVRRAPVQEAPRHSIPTPTTAASRPTGSGSVATGPTAPSYDADGANTAPAGTTPQADPQRSGPIYGFVSNVFHVTNGLR
jgi:hypothetical protein